MGVSIRRGDAINSSDCVLIREKRIEFRLDEKNETEHELILIYMYILPKFQGHGVKVGMAKCRMDEIFWHAIKSRIADQKHELALTDEQYEKYGLEREVVYWGVCVDAKNESFKDYRVHDEIMTKCAGLVEKEQEWFQNIPVDELIELFDKCRKTDSITADIYTPRNEQRRCVDALLGYFKKHKTGGRFLLNCKMRFGKSYTTYRYCEEAKLDRILILTFIPAVESSWKEDLSHIARHYDYFTDANLRKPAFEPAELSSPFVLFLSLQNYLGKDKNSQEAKDKIKKLQAVNWDLVILDEYHFGAWNEKTQDTLESQEDLEAEYQKELRETKDVLERFKIKTKQTICLSGTPFKAIAKGEFNKENTFTYSYFDEQRNKYPNSANGDFSIINPDYAHFPDMKIFGYNMTRLFSGMTASVFSGDTLYGKKYFSLNRFFETKRDSNPYGPCVFVYEKEIKQWLEIIKGRSAWGDKFPYCNMAMLENNKHTLWLLPRVNAVHAMAKLLREDDYFGRYQIINLSESGVGAGVDAFDYLMDNITAANNAGKIGSIALTVNKLTMGVTVKEWFSVFVLKDLASPEQYFQSIFRIQTPYMKKGKILKPKGFVYDFNIDRAAALLLRYAEQSEEALVTKLDICKLIVKYLPIFINGDMSTPIGTEVFYELAEFGDSSGIPLSRKITDTSKTTRLLDDEVIAEMMNDKEVVEIIGKVFSHAKFKKAKVKTPPGKPAADGFETKSAKAGRDKGYSIGMEDYERYVDYDNTEIQAQFEDAIQAYIKKLCPSELTDEQKIWWSNGFIKGYEGGVNAPIKKMKCGHDDGIAFVEEIRKKFGKNIVWKEDTRKILTNFINKHLNDINNIPAEYRGVLYKRWYADSFKRAAKTALEPKVPIEKGKAVEDADNVMKHILARLFEFLYISVYRETTFQEILANADPDVFLEAVGITKSDFDILNKYHIFQERVLNNYIHQFFVNESMGSTLNLEDEEIRAKYRNSFDWFGFGLDGDELITLVQENTKEAVANSSLKVEDVAPMDSIVESDPAAIPDEEALEDGLPTRLFLAYGDNLNTEQMEMRCPGATAIGAGVINGYRLMFKGSTSGNFLTIEQADGYEVPVGVYEVTEEHERSLDHHKEYPTCYYKKNMRITIVDFDGNPMEVDAFVYIMREERGLGAPSERYINTVKQGYADFGFDFQYVEQAIEYSSPKETELVGKILEDKPLIERIKELLEMSPKALKSSAIADKLGVSKKKVNQVLYANKKMFISDSFFSWKLK